MKKFLLITTTKYSPKNKTFVAEYKGFACSVGEYEYEGSKPISFDYKYIFLVNLH